MQKRKKLNCWEFKKCGRRPGSRIAREFGECPALTEKRLDGIHGGKNAGRACWIVAGTMCDGEVQGIFTNKFTGCRLCDFYKAVRREERESFFRSKDLLKKLKK